MIQEISLQTTPREAAHIEQITKLAAGKLNIQVKDISTLRVTRRSVDARGKNIKINLQLLVATGNETIAPLVNKPDYKQVHSAPEVVIVGAGPAGLFAALTLIENGYKPIVIERGKDVSTRKRDIAQLYRERKLNTESNYCFGEGGAGTFSDGKLYTRSNKRGNIRQILETFVVHGADTDILVDAHPHIGSDKLPGVIANMRNTIRDCGGEVLFEARLEEIFVTDNKITAVQVSGNKIPAQRLILATGHSARDVYEILHRSNIQLEAKGFAIGVRVEHPQSLINHIQYHGTKDQFLPTASYTLSTQVDGRGVYSFCMCPGGLIVPASTTAGEVVVNGMSNSLRNSPFANSGIAVEIRPEDISEFSKFGVLAGLRFQQYVEEAAFEYSGKDLSAPGQRLADFVAGKTSNSLPKMSFLPGGYSSPLHEWLPKHISKRLQKGFETFGTSMKGYLTNEAVILGVESRTSSPVRIPRNPETLEHVQISGLFPCGEGAGYSGGITSSAMDGLLVAQAVVRSF